MNRTPCSLHEGWGPCGNEGDATVAAAPCEQARDTGHTEGDPAATDG